MLTRMTSRVVRHANRIAGAALPRSVAAEENVVAGEKMAGFAVGAIDCHERMPFSMLWPASAISDSAALPALPVPTKGDSIFKSVFMTFRAVSAAAFICAKSMATKYILSARHSLKMILINASAVPAIVPSRALKVLVMARMVNRHSLRDRPLFVLIDKAMNVLILFFASIWKPCIKDSVGMRQATGPLKATVGKPLSLRHESREFFFGHGYKYTTKPGPITMNTGG
jgi:hypothetical protein